MVIQIIMYGTNIIIDKLVNIYLQYNYGVSKRARVLYRGLRSCAACTVLYVIVHSSLYIYYSISRGGH